MAARKGRRHFLPSTGERSECPQCVPPIGNAGKGTNGSPCYHSTKGALKESLFKSSLAFEGEGIEAVT